MASPASYPRRPPHTPTSSSSSTSPGRGRTVSIYDQQVEQQELRLLRNAIANADHHSSSKFSFSCSIAFLFVILKKFLNFLKKFLSQRLTRSHERSTASRTSSSSHSRPLSPRRPLSPHARVSFHFTKKNIINNTF